MPVALAVSCSADRQAPGKITRDGVKSRAHQHGSPYGGQRMRDWEQGSSDLERPRQHGHWEKYATQKIGCGRDDSEGRVALAKRDNRSRRCYSDRRNCQNRQKQRDQRRRNVGVVKIYTE